MFDEEQKNEGGVPDHHGKKYRFSGALIKVNEKDYLVWLKSYHAIPDLGAELRAADAYYTERPPKDGKWFFPVSRWLKRAHDQALAARQREDAWRAGVHVATREEILSEREKRRLHLEAKRKRESV